jgi:competence ComEA-like helix-hairpin-helix protein
VAYSADTRRALLWLVSSFGAVAFARYEMTLHPTPPAAVIEARPEPSRPHAALLRDGARMDVNAATAEELELLPGVGPSLARRLVEAREAGGPFRRPEDLARVRGVGAKTRDKLARFLRFDSEQVEHPRQSQLPLGHAEDLSAAH